MTDVYLILQHNLGGSGYQVIGAYSSEYLCNRQVEYLNKFGPHYHSCKKTQLNYIYNKEK